MDDVGLPAGLLLFILFSILGVMLIRATAHEADTGFEVKIYMLAFGARFAASVIIYQFGLIDILKDEDASGWYVGRYWYHTWLDQGVSYFDLPAMFAQSYGEHHKGYYYLVGVLFYITDLPFRLSAAAMNCCLGAWTVIIGYRTARAVFSQDIAVKVAWWNCLYPSLIVWSAQTLKEPVVIFLESLVIYGCVSIRQRGRVIPNLLMMGSSIVLLIPFRFYAAYLAGAAVLLSFLFGSMSSRNQSTKSTYVYFMVTAACALVVAFFLLGREKDAEFFQAYDLKGIETYRNNVGSATGEGAGSSVKIEADLQSPGGFVTSLAIGGTYLLFAPFPWQLVSGSMRMLFAAPEVMLWWWLLITGVFPGLAIAVRTRFRDVLPLLVMVVGLGLLYSLTFGNIGLIYRQRAQLLPWLIVFAAVGKADRNGDPSLHPEHAASSGHSH